jgi:hypothetical protein
VTCWPGWRAGWTPQRSPGCVGCRGTVGRALHPSGGRDLDPHRLDGLFRIGGDEISWRKHHRYVTLVWWWTMTGPRWCGAARAAHAATLDAFFAELGPQRGRPDRGVSLDWGQLHVSNGGSPVSWLENRRCRYGHRHRPPAGCASGRRSRRSTAVTTLTRCNTANAAGSAAVSQRGPAVDHDVVAARGFMLEEAEDRPARWLGLLGVVVVRRRTRRR